MSRFPTALIKAADPKQAQRRYGVGRGRRSGCAYGVESQLRHRVAMDKRDDRIHESAACSGKLHRSLEGKKRGSTRDVRPRPRTIGSSPCCASIPVMPSSTTTGTHAKCSSTPRTTSKGYTFAMRTLEAWGATIENDTRAYYTAGGRVWVLDLEPAAGKKKRLETP